MQSHLSNELTLLLALLLWTVTPARARSAVPEPRRVGLDFEVSAEGSGSVLAANIDGDSPRELVITAPGHISAHDLDGSRLWHVTPEIFFSGSRPGSILPGLHSPGVQIADVDGDGNAEVLFLDPYDTIHMLDARTGTERRSAGIPHPEGSGRWELLVVANLRGGGDRDVVLQTTNAKGYRVAHYLAAYPVDGLDGPPLWRNDCFGALAHGPVRVADLDGDGRDEICGSTILNPDGTGTAWSYPPIHTENAGGASFHIDSLFVADIRPEIPGLEAVLLEEGRNHVALVNVERGILWWKTNERQEPQNAAVGEFDLDHPGLEIWCRSRYNTHQRPWVFDARGELISAYAMDDVAPEGWTDEGVEVITPIHWTGERRQLAVAKERHKRGDVGLFEPMSGAFVTRIRTEADRLYVADVSGDWREEIIVASGRELLIYENDAPNPRPDRPRLWSQSWYRRTKMTWDYYSP